MKLRDFIKIHTYDHSGPGWRLCLHCVFRSLRTTIHYGIAVAFHATTEGYNRCFSNKYMYSWLFVSKTKYIALQKLMYNLFFMPNLKMNEKRNWKLGENVLKQFFLLNRQIYIHNLREFQQKNYSWQKMLYLKYAVNHSFIWENVREK